MANKRIPYTYMSGGVCLCTVPQNRLTNTGFFLMFLFLSQTSLTFTPQAHVDTKLLVSEVAEYKGAHRVLRNFRDFSALPGRGRYFMKLEALFRLSALVDYSDFDRPLDGRDLNPLVTCTS